MAKRIASFFGKIVDVLTEARDMQVEMRKKYPYL
jgi:hypothetical protein